MTPQELARHIDHTLLKPEATPADVDRLCDEALEWNFVGVCVNPCYVAQVAKRVEGSSSLPVSVAGFPLGASATAGKVSEARQVVADGGVEVDMVLAVGMLKAGEHAYVRDDIAAVVDAVKAARADALVKVIFETALLSDDEIIAACRCCAEAQADFVKTSTGFNAAGGASVDAVRLMHKHASPIRVKASAGIRDWPTTKAMLDAGATRIGTSSGVAIIRALASS